MLHDMREVETMARIPVSPEMLLPEVLERYPPTRSVLDCYGLKGCGGTEEPRETWPGLLGCTTYSWKAF